MISPWLRVAAGVAGRPALWGTALRQSRRLAAPGWWRRAPFLPVPAGEYLAFRLTTQYGDSGHRPAPHDVVTYLEWCRRWDALRRAA